MRVRIIKLPGKGDRDFVEFDLSNLHAGEIVNLGPRLGELLMASGYAEPETKERDRATHKRPRTRTK